MPVTPSSVRPRVPPKMSNIKSFDFSYYGPDCSDVSDEFPVRTTITKNIEMSEDATWDVVLNEFLLFLGHCWGYDIKSQVSYDTFDTRIQKMRDSGILEDEDGEEIKGW